MQVPHDSTEAQANVTRLQKPQVATTTTTAPFYGDESAPQTHSYRITYAVAEAAPPPPPPPRRRLVPWSPFWHMAKLVTRAFITLLCFVVVILASLSYTYGQAFGLPPALLGLLYDAAEYFVRFRNMKSRRCMHPAITTAAEAILFVITLVFVSVYIELEYDVFRNGASGTMAVFLLIISIARAALLARAAVETHERQAVDEVSHYFHDPETSEPPVRVMITDLYRFKGAGGATMEHGAMDPPPEFWEGDVEQGSTDKVFVPDELRQ
ncbi:hypothetical protein ACHAQA_007257 [Verticillium albo-atrum]